MLSILNSGFSMNPTFHKYFSLYLPNVISSMHLCVYLSFPFSIRAKCFCFNHEYFRTKQRFPRTNKHYICYALYFVIAKWKTFHFNFVLGFIVESLTSETKLHCIISILTEWERNFIILWQIPRVQFSWCNQIKWLVELATLIWWFLRLAEHAISYIFWSYILWMDVIAIFIKVEKSINDSIEQFFL